MKIQFDEEVDPKNSQNKKLLFQGIGGPKMRDLYVFIKLKNYQSWVFLMFLKSLRKIYSIIFAISNYTKV